MTLARIRAVLAERGVYCPPEPCTMAPSGRYRWTLTWGEAQSVHADGPTPESALRRALAAFRALRRTWA